MWACYFGVISESYRKNWKPHTVKPEQKEPDVYDVLESRQEIMYRLDGTAAMECFTDMIQVDWGGWAYRVTKARALEYNRRVTGVYRIPETVISSMEDGVTYGIIDVEIY